MPYLTNEKKTPSAKELACKYLKIKKLTAF